MDINDELCHSGVCTGPVLFNTSIDNTDEGIGCPPNKFAGDTKLSGMTHLEDGMPCRGSWKGAGQAQKWDHGNSVWLNKTRCKVLHLGQGNPWYQHKLENEQIGSTLMRRIWG
ncbi:hypothetical protein DUI87_08321 [Hirundo rustica rustica]|uniref:Uncharacterized protein n=1 Tax=Hirundo rustica rustica TaxID=333673 RepID=A0A3M0KS39_HIRRU|nr:hypothetical protein DUI87_08321 [Hirundo rustica rustica]